MKELLQKQIPWLDQRQREQLCVYYEMLVDWNTRMNLTAITQPEEVVQKHFMDSLSAAEKGYIPQNARCVDMGTGAGFPGIPLLIARPDVEMVLVDSLKKRITFLEAVCAELGLSARCIHARGEDAGRDPSLREACDIALSRAVASLPVLLELTVPLVKVGGLCIAYKGPAVEEELAGCQNACRELHCELETVRVDASYGQRNLVLARKIAPTSKKYPRKAGTPNQRPL